MRFALHGVALAALLGSAAAAQTEVRLRTHSGFPIGGLPADLLVVDIDADTRPDLVTTNFDVGTISTLLGTGGRDFLLPFDQDSAPAPIQVAAADLDGDTDLDLIISEGEGDWVNLLIANGDGTFLAPRRTPAGHDPQGVVAADVDADGDLDIVISFASETGGSIEILLNNGDATFVRDEANSRRLPAPSYGVAVGELTGDAHLDVAAVTIDGQLAILAGDGTGKVARPDLLPTGEQPFRLALADLDGDGALDILTADGGSDRLTLFRGDGSGGFTRITSYPTGDGPATITVVDIDGDGHLDAVTANTASGDLSVLPGLPGGLFGAARHFAAPVRPFAGGVGDFDADGRLDLVGASTTNSAAEVAVLWGRPGGYEAIESLLPGSGVAGIAGGDLTGDGLADLTVTGGSAEELTLLPAIAGGGFAAPVLATNGVEGSLVRVADVNGDGYRDILAADQEQPDLHVALARGDGTFALPLRADLPGPAVALEVTDFDRDGHLDVAATGRSGVSVGVLYGVGDGTFSAAPALALAGSAAGLAVGDFNGDGRPDIAAGNTAAAHITVFAGAAGRTFADALRLETNAAPFIVTAGDIDDDGFDDIAAQAGSSRQLRLFFGSAAGSFTPANGPNASGIALALRDVTGDLRPDLLIADQINNGVTVVPNLGGRLFGAIRPYVVGLRPAGVDAVDVDGDGRYDVIANAASAWVLTNEAGPAVLASDGNGDGRRSAADLVALARARVGSAPRRIEAAARLAGAGATAGLDGDGDGLVDAFDLAALLRRLF